MVFGIKKVETECLGSGYPAEGFTRYVLYRAYLVIRDKDLFVIGQ